MNFKTKYILCLASLVPVLSGCVSQISKEIQPSLKTMLHDKTFQRRLDLREHPDSEPWRRIFTKGTVFIVLEPGMSQLRVGDETLKLKKEVRLWEGQLYVSREAVGHVDDLLKSLDVSRIRNPEWVPVAEKSWNYIVIHHSAINTGNAALYDRNHREVRGWSGGLGYHFVIGNGSGSQDGEVEIGPRWHQQMHGAHARSGPENTYNLKGIGICLVGDFNLNAAPSKKQLSALVELVNFLRDRYSISLDRIIGHHDVPKGTVTDCPGANFPWKYFMRLLQ